MKTWSFQPGMLIRFRRGGQGLLEEISPTIVASSKTGDNQIHIVVAIHEASGKDITMSGKAYSLVSGGGKPGQGYPCVIIKKG